MRGSAPREAASSAAFARSAVACGAPDFSEAEEEIPPFGPEAPGSFVVLGSGTEIVSPVGQTGKFFMAAEVFGLEFDGATPSLDAGKEFACRCSGRPARR